MMQWDTGELQRLSLFLAKAQAGDISDIHISPGAGHVGIKVRQSGQLQQCQILDSDTGRALIQRVKAQANMNIAETRIAQDGRLPAQAPLHREVRVATHPTLHGENMVLRLFSQQALRTVDQLGVGPETHRRLLGGLDAEEGLILVCGPTGAGKTTTLHALLNELKPARCNMMTLEDPVEILLAGAMQTDLSQLPKMDFALGLKSLLRQDPDVILVGEIRDRETAELAIEAAMTGHLVLASLHAADTLGALARLELLGVTPRRAMPHIRNLICQRLAFHAVAATKHRVPLMQIWCPDQSSNQQRHRWHSLTELADHVCGPSLWSFAQSAAEACASGLILHHELPVWLRPAC
jgi:type II secretory ATPase GspE/PulE/Tfp pilus assembly ATPase PilB-like protein